MGAYDWLTGATPKRSLDNGALLISGAYPRKGPIVKKVEEFAFELGRRIAEREASIVSGNGPTIGNALVDGVQSVKKSEVFQYVCIIPFKQHGTIADMTHAERSEYFYHVRTELLSKANIVIFLSGEKLAKDGTTVNSDTVMTEYSQAVDAGRFCIPVATLGGSSFAIFTDMKQRSNLYKDLPSGLFDKLADKAISTTEMIDTIFEICDWIVEHKLRSRSRRSSISSKDFPGHHRTISGTSIHSINTGISPRAPGPRTPNSAAASRQASYTTPTTVS